MVQNLDQHFAKLCDRIQHPDFLNNQGLSNEVSYYIFPYDAKDAPQLRLKINELKHQPLSQKINLKFVDLYDVMIDSIEKLKGIADKDPIEMVEEMEKRDGFDVVAQQINDLMEMDKEENSVVQYTQHVINKESCVVFITGVGRVFPIIRAHKVLNTMQQRIDNVPIVIFYPGKYNELSLRIFNEAQDQNFYRAFPI